jgi:osmotically-inducible protein OsmY
MITLMEENRTSEIFSTKQAGEDERSILAEAHSRLDHSPYRELLGIDCELRDGVLILRGRVSSYYIKQIAQSAVFSLENVRELDNRLEVDDG